MSWGTEFTANVYLQRQIFESKGGAEDAIKESELEISRYKEQLLILASCNPRDLLQEEDNDLINEIQNRITDIVNIIRDEQRNITLLNLFLHEINKGNYKFEEQKLDL